MTTTHAGIVAALGGYEPSAEQRAAIEHTPSPLAIIAGAGSGKTAVMAARMVHLISTGVAQPNQILGLTFTNKAAQELEDRVRRAIAPLDLAPGAEPSVFTYNSFADRLIRDYGPKIGIEPGVALLSEAQSYMLFAGLLEELTFDVIPVRGISYMIGRMRSLADQCSNHLLDPEQLLVADAALVKSVFEGDVEKLQRDLRKTIEQRPDYVKAVRAYIDRKRELARIDYGDQIAFGYQLVTQRPEVAAVLRERWPVCLLDEYQDTNVAQRKMMEAIYPAGSAITVVGDPDQAIYAWRGATLHNILYFPQHFTAADGKPADKRPLEVSFRSGRAILDVADAIISRVATDRRGVPDKVLRHHEATGAGDVTCDLVASDEDEARLIAAEIKALAGVEGASLGGTTIVFDEIAILCRKRRLFGKILIALRAEGIPVEVVGLGGLLQLPEIMDLMAYLRLVVHPEENIPFARIAMGPRWRIHYADMAALARWAARNTNRFREQLAELEDNDKVEVDPGSERFSLAEAAGRSDEVDELSEGARSSLTRLHAEIEAMRVAIKSRSLTEAVEKILEMSGIEDELLSANTVVAAAALGNISSFLDRAAAFAPLEGSGSLEAFLDFIETAASVEDIEVAQPQMDNCVKLMTVHQAKGLEFDVVFIPGLSAEVFPDFKVNENPTTTPASVPFWARDDQDFLPRFGGVMKKFHDELKERQEEEERRLAYVAMTRARKALRLTAAHWYGVGNYERKHPNGPGLFFNELAGAPATDDAPEGSPHPAVTVRRKEPCPSENPLTTQWEERAKQWPPSDEIPSDALLPEGPRRAVESARERPDAVAELAVAHGIDLARFESARAEIAHQLELVTMPPPVAPPDDRLKALSVSSMVQLARCPKQFYWTIVRPLPRRPSEAARVGNEIHRWIELRAMGQRRLDDPEIAPDMSPEERLSWGVRGGSEPQRSGGKRPPEAAKGIPIPHLAEPLPQASLSAGEKGGVPELDAEAQLKATFESSPYASLHPRHVEQPFVIWLDGGFLVRGRIDAVYRHDDGTWELVDYKTGSMPAPGDDTAAMQLSIYAIAAGRMWGIEPANLRVTYFYLKSGAIVTTPATELTLDETHLIERFRLVEAGAFEPVPGPLCYPCDFRRFCSAGQRFVADDGDEVRPA
ncbi:MAG TPA: ATP-dependent DNA helicase [Actinomycetota bacterium]|nr:ATP-dependent DNA helicase [Actinomycetota bacterium]